MLTVSRCEGCKNLTVQPTATDAGQCLQICQKGRLHNRRLGPHTNEVNVTLQIRPPGVDEKQDEAVAAVKELRDRQI